MGAFVKGDSRINRKGRPRKGKSLTEILEKALRSEKNYKALADILIEMALKDRNITAIRYIYDRIDGKPKETVELENGALDIKLLEIMNDGK
jgi:hypothetical protein